MTWSYSGDPTTSNLDVMRILLGDTDTNHQLLQDEELNFYILQQNNLYYAAYLAADAIAAHFAPGTQESLGDWSGSYQQRYEHFVALARSLKLKAAEGNCRIEGGGAYMLAFFGGVEPVEYEADEHQRRFKRDQMIDNTW